MTNREMDLKIIEEVKKPGREVLFDLGHADYKNLALKRVIWKEIGECLGLPVETVKKRWKSLRAGYVRVMRPPKSGSAGPSNNKESWMLRTMEFLRDHMQQEPTESSFTSPPEVSNIDANFHDETPGDLESSVDLTEQSTPKPPPKKKIRTEKNPFDPMMQSVLKTMDAHRRMIDQQVDLIQQPTTTLPATPSTLPIPSNPLSLLSVYTGIIEKDFLKFPCLIK